MNEEKSWDDAWGEISGFGGSYEAGCRAMVLAGIEWVDEHPDVELKFAGFKNVFGLVTEENAAAKQLTQVMLDAEITVDGKHERVGENATGAMHHAAVNHVMAYKRLGWDEYRRQLRDRGSA